MAKEDNAHRQGPEYAKVLCAEHLDADWSDPSDIQVDVLNGGFLNAMYLCTNEKLVAEDENNHSRNKVIVRFISGKFPMVLAGEAAEAIAMDAISKAGLGPKLLGVFRGGRLEEYQKSRMLKSRDARDPNILISVAKATARMHSLDVPIKRTPQFRATNYRNVAIEVLEKWQSKDLSVYSQRVRDAIKKGLSRGLIQELDWMHETLKVIKTRVVFSHMDYYINNILLKDDHGDIIDEKDISIIDMDTVAYFYRGADIGCYLFESAFDYTDHDNPKLAEELSEDQKRLFIRTYLEKWKELNPSKFNPEIDNVDAIYLESEVLSLYLGIIFPLVVLTNIHSNGIAFAENLSDATLHFVFEKRVQIDHRVRGQTKELLRKAGYSQLAAYSLTYDTSC